MMIQSLLVMPLLMQPSISVTFFATVTHWSLILSLLCARTSRSLFAELLPAGDGLNTYILASNGNCRSVGYTMLVWWITLADGITMLSCPFLLQGFNLFCNLRSLMIKQYVFILGLY